MAANSVGTSEDTIACRMVTSCLDPASSRRFPPDGSHRTLTGLTAWPCLAPAAVAPRAETDSLTRPASENSATQTTNRSFRSNLGARYALVVSIETPGVETDIWTPVAQQIGVPVEIAT
jgi:hypothetical protein